MFQALFSFSKLIITFIAIKASFQRSCYHWNLLCVLLWKLDEICWYRCCLMMITISVNSLITITSYFFQLLVHLSVLLLCLIQGVFFTGPALKVLSMELVPPNKEIDWFRHNGMECLYWSVDALNHLNNEWMIWNSALKSFLGRWASISSDYPSIPTPSPSLASSRCTLLGGTSSILKTFTAEPVIFIYWVGPALYLEI